MAKWKCAGPEESSNGQYYSCITTLFHYWHLKRWWWHLKLQDCLFFGLNYTNVHRTVWLSSPLMTSLTGSHSGSKSAKKSHFQIFDFLRRNEKKNMGSNPTEGNVFNLTWIMRQFWQFLPTVGSASSTMGKRKWNGKSMKILFFTTKDIYHSVWKSLKKSHSTLLRLHFEWTKVP